MTDSNVAVKMLSVGTEGARGDEGRAHSGAHGQDQRDARRVHRCSSPRGRRPEARVPEMSAVSSTSSAEMASKGVEQSRSAQCVPQAEVRSLPTPMRRQQGPLKVAKQAPLPWSNNDLWAAGSGGTSKGSYRERLQARGQEAMQRSFAANMGPGMPATLPPAASPMMYMMSGGSYGASPMVPPPPMAPPQPWELAAAAACVGTPMGSEASLMGFPGLQQPWAPQPSWQLAPGRDASLRAMQIPQTGGWADSNDMSAQQQWEAPMTPMSSNNSPTFHAAPWTQDTLMAALMPAVTHMDPEELAAQLRAAAPETYDDKAA
eukprot:CAMPEP_0177272086 /NCGR_PEP_ID=MMETSP0367-20130122/65884_1 /TAXON_ID=447022 ORGANISM="Scrippsiella hangoei-like, Strain SHHI-4" /NCGR_SAMPLE_ID=MMETSP0367 /ASSEMBLY_ACC=CAM_ASM_000362 /LENGTH=317 /DNA_ID=CAMNT_0018728207 /DNA_START=19 /DNA_END=969 /DNA_ORIENTATION=+